MTTRRQLTRYKRIPHLASANCHKESSRTLLHRLVVFSYCCIKLITSFPGFSYYVLQVLNLTPDACRLHISVAQAAGYLLGLLFHQQACLALCSTRTTCTLPSRLGTELSSWLRNDHTAACSTTCPDWSEGLPHLPAISELIHEHVAGQEQQHTIRHNLCHLQHQASQAILVIKFISFLVCGTQLTAIRTMRHNTSHHLQEHQS